MGKSSSIKVLTADFVVVFNRHVGVLPNVFQQGNDTLFLKDQVAHPVLADALFELIAEAEFIFGEMGFKVFETDGGQVFERITDLIEMGGKDEKAVAHIDQSPDNGQ